jgi:SH3 domain-binding glutamic acid-rich protein
MSQVTYFFSGSSSNLTIKKQQQRIQMILESKRIPFEAIDISKDPAQLKRMRDIVGDPKATPPQLVTGEEYCGSFDQFEEALETDNDALFQFLKLT